MILQYFVSKENRHKDIAEDIYKSILSKSNLFIKQNDFFFKKDYNTSFEVVSIFLIFYMKFNINNKISNYSLINDQIIATFINDLDESLRIKGIGDMSIGKYVKSYVKKFYFRLKKFPDIENNYKENYVDYLKLLKLTKEDMYLEASEKLNDEFIQISKQYKDFLFQ